MSRVYNNAPIVEALVEFRFGSEQWDWTIPGLVYERVRKDFPEKRQQNVLEVEMRAEASEIAHNIKGGTARMQFYNKEQTSLIQLGPDLLTVNFLKPYPTWSQFQEVLWRIFDVYLEEAEPESVKRIGVRYINRIEIPEKHPVFQDYFRVFPTIPVVDGISDFLMQVQIPFWDDGGILRLIMGSDPNQDSETSSFILDLDFFTSEPIVSIDQVQAWTEKAHSQIERIFESCITDQARELFDEVIP